MCIACELGYWAMVDALEAERSAARQTWLMVFACEPGTEKVEPRTAPGAPRTVDKPTP